MTMNTSVPVIIPLLAALFATPVSESPGLWRAGEANGTLTVNDQVVDIRHAYVRAEPGQDGLRYHVILSDMPMDATLLNDEGEMWKRSRDAKLHYVLLEVNADGPDRIDLRHPAFQPLGYVSVGGTPYVFEAATLTAERIEAHAYMKEPVTSFGDSWTYDIRFSAQVKHGDSW